MTSGDALPAWRSVLAVVAHPDDESFALGAVLSAFAEHGGVVAVLCLTHGEASTVHGVSGDLAVVREKELADAADELGVTRVILHGFPDGGLAGAPSEDLAAAVRESALETRADGILAFDLSGVTGHQDHATATRAAVVAAEELGLPVLGWTLPAATADVLNAELSASFTGHDVAQVDLVVTVDRTRQQRAVTCHASQAVPGSVLWRRLELLAGTEHLRWLAGRPAENLDPPPTRAAVPTPAPPLTEPEPG